MLFQELGPNYWKCLLGISTPNTGEKLPGNCGEFDFVWDIHGEITLACGSKYFETTVDGIEVEVWKGLGAFLNFAFDRNLNSRVLNFDDEMNIHYCNIPKAA